MVTNAQFEALTRSIEKLSGKVDTLSDSVHSIDKKIDVHCAEAESRATDLKEVRETTYGNGHRGIKTKVNIIWWVGTAIVLPLCLSGTTASVWLLVRNLSHTAK